MDDKRQPPSRSENLESTRSFPERKRGGDAETTEAITKSQGLKRPASLVDVSENTNSTDHSTTKVVSRLKRQAEEVEDEEDDDDDDDDDDDVLDPAQLASLSRSERKRYREKKRRSDVNKGFEDLMALLLEIDPAVRAEAEERARRGQWKGTVGASQDESLLSRVDLIARTVNVLRRLHDENEQRKLIIGQLIQESTQNDPHQNGRDQVCTWRDALAVLSREFRLHSPSSIIN